MVLAVLVLILLPMLEVYVIVQVGAQIGFWNTLGAMILVGLVGSWLVRRQGSRAWRRFNEQVAKGEKPTREIADGLCLILAGILLILPGFVSDILGLALLLPPTRALLRGVIVRRAEGAVAAGRMQVVTARYDRDGVRETTAREVRGQLEP